MDIKIGIPRAIQFYQHYPFWRTFFEELGAETVVSPPTNREIVTAGAKVVADVTCLPVKVYAGHVSWLRDCGNVDFVFSPAIWNLEEGAFHCSKLKGLPDIIKATVPNCPHLLVAEVDPVWRKLYEKEAYQKVGRMITKNPWKISQAWELAKKKDREYLELILREQLTYPEAMARFYGPEWLTTERVQVQESSLVIGLAGHPYCLYDDYINHNLIRRLGEMGVKIVTGEMVRPEQAERGIEHMTRQKRWFFDRWVSGAAGYFMYEARMDGIITAVAFGCGPDSTMVETISRRAHSSGSPFLNLVLDEHGSATGMVTRLEAFVDMLLRRKQTNQTNKITPPVEPKPSMSIPLPVVLTKIHQPVVGIPRMGTTAIPVKSLFTGIGAQVEMGPPVSKPTVSLGAASSPEFICTPYKQILGNMIQMLEAGADTLIYVDGLDLCRNSSYHQLMEDALHDLGYKFHLMTFAQIYEGGVFAIPKFLRQFSPELTWQKVLQEVDLAISKIHLIDQLERRVQYLRPREVAQGTVDKLWEQALNQIEEVRDGTALKRTLRDLHHNLDRIETDPARRPVKIGLTGEIFAALDSFYNQDIERQLGRAGAEVHRPLMISNWMNGEMIMTALGLPHNQDVNRAARPYLRANVSGEAFATLGETVLCAQKGFDGMVELLPFTCEPEITAMNILPRVSQDYNIPVLSFIFDEQSGRAGMQTRIEAFIDLLYRRREVRESSRKAPPPRELPTRTFLGEDACSACAVSLDCSRNASLSRTTHCKLNIQGSAGWRQT